MTETVIDLEVPAKPKPRRNRKSSRDGGTRHNRHVAAYLAEHLDDDRIDVRHPNGAKDRGDVGGIRHMGQRVVVECKDVAKTDISGWLREAEIERRNDDAVTGLVVAKRRGVAVDNPADQLVLMTLRDLVALMRGSRPEDGEK